MFALQRRFSNAPIPLIAVLLSTAAVAIFDLDRRGVAIIGEIPAGLPQFALPQISFRDITSLVAAAIEISIVGYSDNVLTARAFANRNNYKIDVNQELLALGVANFGNGLMQGFPERDRATMIYFMKQESRGKSLRREIQVKSQILAEPKETRALVAGLAGEPTYLTIVADGKLDTVGIVDNCTHLGCTFPWNENDNQFQCPCHGSCYAADGSVVRGPAPLPLKLAQVSVAGDYIRISPWTQTDPRTGKKPWWV